MTKILTAGAVLTLGFTLSLRAEAQTLVSAEEPEEVASIVRELGFQAKIEKDDLGDPVIRSSSGGVDFRIYFYGCKSNKRCKSLHFSVGYDLEDGSTLEAVQQWNADKRFASAYLDNESDPFLQMDINMEGGVTQKNFETSLELWQSLKGEFEDFIGFNDKSPRVSSAPVRDTGA